MIAQKRTYQKLDVVQLLVKKRLPWKLKKKVLYKT